MSPKLSPIRGASCVSGSAYRHGPVSSRSIAAAFRDRRTAAGLLHLPNRPKPSDSLKVLPYHVQVGNWIREHRGIYRLTLFPIAELNPSKVHMTVPTDFRRSSDIPSVLVLH
uniref:Uncharacterized protein n=1 Tax=Solibacter usitatus (strain Ellin6076) TaxID=234267 RepID=Q02CE1_SOLUE